MRTFIFIKRDKKGSYMHQYIVGMVQSDMFPSYQNDPESRFYLCHCIEVTEKCHIDLGKTLD